jgi:xanthine dehydrogenase large subunit
MHVGFDDNGRLCGLQLTMAAHCGFSADLSGPVADRAVFHADNAYFLKMSKSLLTVASSTPRATRRFAAFGGPQGMIVTETILSDIGRHLGWTR